MKYRRLLFLLRGRDRHDRQAIHEDAELLLADARNRGRGAVVTTWAALLWDVARGGTQDLARAVRSHLRSPGFAVTVSLLLGLGVAATTTLFASVSVVDGLKALSAVSRSE